MRKSFLKKVSSKSFAGRVLRRLLGEERGAVMMEYIVVALLIAAACVVAVAMFGRTISDMFGVAATAATGDHRNAQEQQNAAQANTKSGMKAASDHVTDVHSKKSGTEVGTDKWD